MFKHKPVLEQETIDALQINPAGTYVDCTLGGGGHSEQIVSRLNDGGLLVAFDQDIHALRSAKKRLAPYEDRILFIHRNFRHLEHELTKHNIENVQGVLFDLGVSSPQLDEKERGFSYRYNATLDMRMDQSQQLSALEIVNEWPYHQLVKIFFKYGEERFSKRIARKIEQQRKKQEITTTHELVNIIKDAIPAPARRKGGHPAKRVFQALRIAVNDELNAFHDALHQAAKVVDIKGRIVVITFHSLEDRICKRSFNTWSTAKEVPKNLPIIPADHEAPFKRITRKPIVATEEELTDNPRAKSAKLRVVEKTNHWDDDFTYTEGWNK
ncbi:MAG TPA: 16S rRNA (cytosine(1402)-N(4))-methyltransferase RsmH [Bacillota bacterium]